MTFNFFEMDISIDNCRAGISKTWPIASASAARWVILLALLAYWAGAASLHAGVIFNVGSVNGFRGGTIAVPIQMVGTTNVVGIQFDLSYSPSQILSGYPFTGLGTNAPTVLSAQMTTARRRTVVYSRNNSILTNGILIYIPLTVKTNTANGSSALTLSNLILADANGTNRPVDSSTNGTLTVAPSMPAQLGSIVLLSNGSVEFLAAGSEGAAYTIQVSTNLTDWTSAKTFLTNGGVIDFKEQRAPNLDRQFFRAVGQ